MKGGTSWLQAIDKNESKRPWNRFIKKKVNALFWQWVGREVERLLANICYEIKPNL